MSNLARGISNELRKLPSEFDKFRQEVLGNQKKILEATQKRFRKARKLPRGQHENVCVVNTDATPGRGKLWHGTLGEIGEYWQDDDGLWNGKVELDITMSRQIDIRIWASNLVYATEEENVED